MVSFKTMLVMTLVFVVVGVPLIVKGRDLKNEGPKNVADVHPDNFIGGFGSPGIFPTIPGGTGGIPSAGGLGSGTGGIPGVGGLGSGTGGIPGVGGLGSGTRFGVGGGAGHGSAIDYCPFPSLGCVRVQPTIPGAGAGGVGGVGTPTLPFP